VLLFTLNKDSWPIRRKYLTDMTIITQNGHLPAKVTSSPKSLPSFKHGSCIQEIFINMTFEMVTAVDFGIISD